MPDGAQPNLSDSKPADGQWSIVIVHPNYDMPSFYKKDKVHEVSAPRVILFTISFLFETSNIVRNVNFRSLFTFQLDFLTAKTGINAG